MTKQQASEWQRLAKVPKDEFEKALADTSKFPSGRRIVDIGLHNAWVHDAAKLREQGELMPLSPAHQKEAERVFPKIEANERQWTIEEGCFIAFGRSEPGKKLISRMACGRVNSMVAALSLWIEANWKNLMIPPRDELERMFAVEAERRKPKP